MTTVALMVCGCDHDHVPGCWLAEAEAIAAEAVTAATLAGRPHLVAVVEALHEAGHLRDLTGADQLLGFLDQLVELGLLGPAAVSTDA